MKNIYKILLASAMVFCLCLPVRHIYAQNPNENVNQNLNRACQIDASSSLCQEQRKVQGQVGSRGIYGPDGILAGAADLIAVIAGIAAVIMIIFGAIKYVTAGGDPQKTGSAQRTILFAAIGLVVTAGARFLLTTLLDRLAS